MLVLTGADISQQGLPLKNILYNGLTWPLTGKKTLTEACGELLRVQCLFFFKKEKTIIYLDG